MQMSPTNLNRINYTAEERENADAPIRSVGWAEGGNFFSQLFIFYGLEASIFVLSLLRPESVCN